MNIYEALKHDCRIRRAGELTWHEVSDPAVLRIDDLKANDWEIEGPTIQLSKNDYFKLLQESMKEEMTSRNSVYLGDQTEMFHQGIIGRLTRKLFPDGGSND